MGFPLVSVTIPTYKGADFLGETIRSVLNQTYTNFELIIVSDASPDRTDDLIREFSDARLRYIVHEKNQGAAAARNTAIRAATGSIIAFLDQDDLLHPEKLARHVAVYEQYPHVGMTYNARFELNHSSLTVREIYGLSRPVTQAELVIGYPFSPSDVMVRREWLERVGLWDEDFPFYGEELVLFARLFMAGCTMAGIDRALNYRRRYSGRIVRDLPGACAAELAAQECVLSDPRCPSEIKALKNVAFANTYRVWAFCAFAQDDIATGQAYLRESVKLEPATIEGNPSALVKFLVYNSIADESVDHVALLETLFSELPTEIASLSKQREWAIGYGFILKATRAIIWNRLEDGCAYFAQAAQWRAAIDDNFIDQQAHQLLCFAKEMGAEALQEVLKHLIPHLLKFGTPAMVHRLQALLYVNRAFAGHRCGEDMPVLRDVVRAVSHDPRYLSNRGVLSIAVRSTARLLSQVILSKGRPLDSPRVPLKTE